MQIEVKTKVKCQQSLTLILWRRGGCCNPLRFFLKQRFLPNKLHQMLLCLLFLHLLYMHPLMYIWGEIWGCRLGVGDVKDYSGGVVKSHNFHFVYFIDILQDICFKLAMKMRIMNSSHNQPKNQRKSYVSVIFQKIIDFLLIFMYIFNTFKFARACWLKWCHGDVIWSSVVLIMISMDREDPYLYTGSKYRGIKHSV